MSDRACPHCGWDGRPACDCAERRANRTPYAFRRLGQLGAPLYLAARFLRDAALLGLGCGHDDCGSSPEMAMACFAMDPVWVGTAALMLHRCDDGAIKPHVAAACRCSMTIRFMIDGLLSRDVQ